jgi:hypothetical protein
VLNFRGVVAESDDVIKNAFEGLGKSGFINYFGLQVYCRTLFNVVTWLSCITTMRL